MSSLALSGTEAGPPEVETEWALSETPMPSGVRQPAGSGGSKSDFIPVTFQRIGLLDGENSSRHRGGNWDEGTCGVQCTAEPEFTLLRVGKKKSLAVSLAGLSASPALPWPVLFLTGSLSGGNGVHPHHLPAILLS